MSYKLHPQETLDGKWIWWLIAPNNVAIAKSCRKYKTQRGAVQAALKVADSGHTHGVEVEWR